MGRKDATRRLDLAKEIKLLDDAGVIHGIRNVADLDEAAGAYKDIELVMRQQEDLTTSTVQLRPLGVIKG
jgi:tRNA-splicing ligase RtcB